MRGCDFGFRVAIILWCWGIGVYSTVFLHANTKTCGSYVVRLVGVHPHRNEARTVTTCTVLEGAHAVLHVVEPMPVEEGPMAVDRRTRRFALGEIRHNSSKLTALRGQSVRLKFFRTIHKCNFSPRRPRAVGVEKANSRTNSLSNRKGYLRHERFRPREPHDQKLSRTPRTIGGARRRASVEARLCEFVVIRTRNRLGAVLLEVR